jgi:hypothetical protein
LHANHQKSFEPPYQHDSSFDVPLHQLSIVFLLKKRSCVSISKLLNFQQYFS